MFSYRCDLSLCFRNHTNLVFPSSTNHEIKTAAESVRTDCSWVYAVFPAGNLSDSGRRGEKAEVYAQVLNTPDKLWKTNTAPLNCFSSNMLGGKKEKAEVFPIRDRFGDAGGEGGVPPDAPPMMLGGVTRSSHEKPEELAETWWCWQGEEGLLGWRLEGFNGVLQLWACGKRWWYRSRRRYFTVTSFPSNQEP